jgi:serine/threonine-protein kinase
MSVEGLIDRAVENIADGQPVNWDLLDSQANGDDERKQLKMLRILEEIAHLHRSTQDDDVEETFGSTRSVPSESLADSSAGASDELSASLEGGAAGIAAAKAAAGAATAGVSAAALKRMDVWGRFHLLEKVGEGSFGSVYRAWDPQLERQIAIKILHRHLTDDRLRAKLLREGRALAKIRQSNVVSVLEVEEHEGSVGLCMEFVQGQTLEDVLQLQGTFSARETVLVGEDVCRALAAVHNAGFVHRDVKARNVMREQAGRIVLMDFGTGREARALEDASRPDVAGTPLYMAPEVLAGEPASMRSDVYAVGVLLYHLVTSGYPIVAQSIDELRAAHQAHRRRYLSEIRPDLPMPFVRVVERALSEHPQDRYPNAGALLGALGTALGDLHDSRWEAARPLLRAAAAISLVAVLPVLLGFLTSMDYNAILQRTEFANDTVWDWWVWGARAAVAPVVAILVAGFPLVLFAGVRNLLRGASSRVRQFDDSARKRAAAWAKRLSLDDVSVLSSWVFLLSTTALVVTWWYFWPLMAAYAKPVSDATSDQLALLSPANKEHHFAYRKALTLLVLLTTAAWYGVLKVSALRRRRLSGGLAIGSAAVLGLMLVTLVMPFRLLYHNRSEVATWNGSRCYITGERAETTLVFCPGLPARNHAVPRTEVTRGGVVENIFTSFGPAAKP